MEIRQQSIKTQARFENKRRKLQAFIELAKTEGEEVVERPATTSSATDEKTEEERIREERKIRRNEYRNRPRIILLDAGFQAKLDACQVTPVSLFEIQATIIACLLPPVILPFRPTICDVQRSHMASRVVIFVLKEDLEFEIDDMELLCFQHVIRFTVEENWTEKLLLVPLTGGQVRKLQEKGMDSKDVKEDVKEDHDEDRKAKKTELLLSLEQMKVENFPLPDDESHHPTLDHYDPVTDDSPLFGLDCEMCRTTTGELEVTRITLVNEQEEVVIETFVRAKNPITDYLTEYSGVTADLLKDVKTELEDVYEMLKKVLPSDAILVGQSLETDLIKLCLRHPYVIDTSVIFNLSGTRQIKASLKYLAKKFLAQDIQSGFGHCSKEDAIAALRLVQLKLEKGIRFGDAVIDPMRATWMKGKGHLVPLSHFINAKGIDFKIFYDYSDSSVSRCMLILGPGSTAKQAKQMIFDTLSTTGASMHQQSSPAVATSHSICVVLTSNGRCFLTCK